MNKKERSQTIFATKELNEKYGDCNKKIEAVNKKRNKKKARLLVNIKTTEKEINMLLNEQIQEEPTHARLTEDECQKTIRYVNH